MHEGPVTSTQTLPPPRLVERGVQDRELAPPAGEQRGGGALLDRQRRGRRRSPEHLQHLAATGVRRRIAAQERHAQRLEIGVDVRCVTARRLRRLGDAPAQYHLHRDQLHAEEPLRVVGEQLVEPHQVGVKHPGERTELALEPVDVESLGPAEDLDRDLDAACGVARGVHRAVAA